MLFYAKLMYSDAYVINVKCDDTWKNLTQKLARNKLL